MVQMRNPKNSSVRKRPKQSNLAYYSKRIKNEAVGIFSSIKATVKDPQSMAKKLKKTSRSSKKSAGKATGLSMSSAPSKRIYQKMKKHDWAKKFYQDAPKSKLHRMFWYVHPTQIKNYWFSKHGARIAGITVGGSLLFGVVAAGSVYAFYSSGLPDPRTLGALEEGTKFYDRTGETLLYEVYGDKVRTVVEYDQISQDLVDATVAIEDKNFYDHIGISPSGILRAAFRNATSTSGTQGGSTLTQQFIKNKVLTNERKLDRKIKEAILALELERLYTKEEILSFYLNTIPYGGTAYGIESAATTYFDKSAKDLTLDESALLAALPQAPTLYSPYGEKTDLLVGRQKYVLEQMLEQGYITQEEFDEAAQVETLAKVVRNTNAYANILAPHFVLEVQRQLEERYGAQLVAEGGLKVITTIDMDLQGKAEQAIANGIANIDRRGGNNAALVAEDQYTGQVLAMVGSRDFTHPEFGSFNAALALRQPGSSVKPYTYATLMRENYGAGSVFYDVPTDFGGDYKPGNYDNRFTNQTTIRKSLEDSRNIPAIKALYIAGIDNVIQTWKDLGLESSDLDASRLGLSFGIGSAEVKLAEHVNAYSSFANGGMHYEQTYILKITNNNGEVLEEFKDPSGEQVFDPQITSIITDILKGVPKVSPGGTQLAAKTGTTNSKRDGWQMGYSTRLVAGIWTGHSQNEPMTGFSTQTAGPIWDDFMTLVHKDNPAAPFEKVSGLKNITLDSVTGRLPDEATTAKVTDIFPSWYKGSSSSNESVEIDTVSGKKATECTPPAARKTIVANGISAEIPSDDPAFSRWNPPVQALAARLGRSGAGSVAPTGDDDVHKCNDAKPTVSLSVNSLGDGKYEMVANVGKGTFPLQKLEFKIDNVVVSGGSMTVKDPGTYKREVQPSSNGQQTFSVTVTDEGLYENQASKQVSVSGASGNSGDLQAKSPSGGVTSNPVEFTWTKDNDADGYRLHYTRNDGSKQTIGSDKLSNKNSNSYTATNLSPGVYEWYVESVDDDGDVLQTSGRKSFVVT